MSAPYPNLSKSREQIAKHIADGYPSPVKYTVTRLIPSVILPGYVHAIPSEPPVHLRRG